MFEFDLVVAVVDVDGSEFAEHIFAEESVEVGAQNVAEAIEIHDGDAAGEPCGDLDVAIVCDPRRNRKIRYTPLFEDEMVVIVSPEHRMAGKPYAEPEDFTDETLLLFPPKSESSLLNEVLTPAGIAPRRIQDLTLTEAIIDLVRGNLGVAAVARWAAAPQLASGAVVGLRLTADGFHRNWAAAQLRSKSAAPYLDEFVKVLAQLPLTACVPDFEKVEAKKYRTMRTRRHNVTVPNRVGEPPVAVGSR